jgi:hypothetical protein
MILLSDVTEYYQYFYSKRFESQKYKFKPSEKGLRTINTFLDLIKKTYPSMGRKFLWRYFTFQFLYWEDLELEAFFGKFRIELVVGKKAFQRWLDRNKDFDNQIDSNDLKEKYDIKKSDLINPIIEAPVHYPYDENAKRMYFGTSKGFATCLQFTTLYDNTHVTCQKCPYADDCKKILLKTYPQLYERRGYAGS